MDIQKGRRDRNMHWRVHQKIYKPQEKVNVKDLKIDINNSQEFNQNKGRTIPQSSDKCRGGVYRSDYESLDRRKTEDDSKSNKNVQMPCKRFRNPSQGSLIGTEASI